MLPAPGDPILIEATVDGAVSAQLQYVIGFGAVTTVPVPLVDDTVSTQIPGQPAGTLVRYRLIGYSAEPRAGTWPRQGDGATYTGTTVASSTTSALLHFE